MHFENVLCKQEVTSLKSQQEHINPDDAMPIGFDRVVDLSIVYQIQHKYNIHMFIVTSWTKTMMNNKCR